MHRRPSIRRTAVLLALLAGAVTACPPPPPGRPVLGTPELTVGYTMAVVSVPVDWQGAAPGTCTASGPGVDDAACVGSTGLSFWTRSGTPGTLVPVSYTATSSGGSTTGHTDVALLGSPYDALNCTVNASMAQALQVHCVGLPATSRLFVRLSNQWDRAHGWTACDVGFAGTNVAHGNFIASGLNPGTYFAEIRLVDDIVVAGEPDHWGLGIEPCVLDRSDRPNGALTWSGIEVRA